MQTCFAVINKDTKIANYLKHRSIIDITEEHRTLTEINPAQLDIVDVDKLLYIYYNTDDADISFRSDMNMLRTLTSSAFFHVDELLFVLVDCENPMLEDFISSALRDSGIPRSKIEVVHHAGALMLTDVGKYIAGSAVGQQSSSSYKDVYIREADKEENDRFVNARGKEDIVTVLPTLTDMSAIYQQRASIEAISSGHVVSDKAVRPQVVSEFSRLPLDSARIITSFVVSGKPWTTHSEAVRYLCDYFTLVGERVFVINLDTTVKCMDILDTATYTDIMRLRSPSTPEENVTAMDARFNQISYIIQFLKNVRGVSSYIFNVCDENYKTACELISQLSERIYSIFITHYNAKAIEEYLAAGYKSSALFLEPTRLWEDFDIQAYKEDFKGQLVAMFPVEDVDLIEFFTFAKGGIRSDD